MRKDIKKSSYYVWFLGAQEAKGLRGLEYIAPVVRSLVEREKEVEPFKVTLQVSHKGLKIVQNVPGAGVAVTPSAMSKAAKGGSNGGGKPEVVKHFIPHHAVTCVHQQEDLVSCILLLYNPFTKCPVHVHAYRCDSVETATVLHGQLRVLIDRPDNQKKLDEIEARLTAKGLLGPPQRRRVPPPGSDGRSTRESESSGGSSSERLSGVGHQERIASMYDSLAAELREKLGTGKPQSHAPILLPPRDYDTVHRQKGNLSEINARRCLNANIVGVNASSGKPSTATPGKIGSSGGSSGIGSDHAPSPDQETDARFLDNHSTSDEEWNADPKDSLFLVQSGHTQASWRSNSGGELSLPRARRLNSSGFDSPTSPVLPDTDASFRRNRANNSNCAEPEIQYLRKGSQNHDSFSAQDYRQVDEQPVHPEFTKLKKHHSLDSTSQPGSNSNQPLVQRRRKNAEDRQRSPSPTNAKSTVGSLTPRDRFNDAKEKFLSLERGKQEEQERQERALINERRRNNQPIEPPISPSVVPVLRSRLSKSWSRSKESDDDIEQLSQNEYLAADENYKYQNERDYLPALKREPSYLRNQLHGSIPDSEDFPSRQHKKLHSPYIHREDQPRKVNPSPSRRNLESYSYGIPEEKCNPPVHRRYASPRRDQSPEVKSRKERGTSPINHPRPTPRKYSEEPPVEDLNSRYIGQIPRSHLSLNPVPFAENNNAIPLERYRSPTRVTAAPRPSPRHQRFPTPNSEEEEEHRDYRQMRHPENRNFPPRPHYDNSDKKRRSMYESIEDERRRNSNELAKEFKRRSFQDHGQNMDMSCSNSLGYQELDDRERYPGLDRETARVHPGEETQTTSPRYRHSYAEPFHQYQPQHHEMLHRTNSSLSSGRVGMAAIHPY